MNLFLSTLLVFTWPAFAISKETVIKECTVSLKPLEGDGLVDLKMEILLKGDQSVFSRVTQSVDGVSSSYTDVAEIAEENVRENLTQESDPEVLNPTERLVVHALTLSEDPAFQGVYTSGINLKEIRRGKTFTVGERTAMGSATIFEAKNADGKVMGSFLSGFLISPCK